MGIPRCGRKFPSDRYSTGLVRIITRLPLCDSVFARRGYVGVLAATRVIVNSRDVASRKKARSFDWILAEPTLAYLPRFRQRISRYIIADSSIDWIDIDETSPLSRIFLHIGKMSEAISYVMIFRTTLSSLSTQWYVGIK